jgi:O-acetyl-ADP-ribose deacetylase (regulator of RNase III)
MDKNNDISKKIVIVQGDIIKITNEYNIEMVVNAAKPSLMGGSGIDGAIHNAVDALNESDFLKNQIKKTICCDDPQNERIVRCEHGAAISTPGFGLSKYIIHAVGSKWDGGSKSCIDNLKSCYKDIFKILSKKRCTSIVIPVISSGSYGFAFDLAAQIEIVAVFNFLIKLKRTDVDYFEQLDKIYLVVYTENDINSFKAIYEKYRKIVNKKSRDELLYLTEAQSHDAYLKEVKMNDYPKRKYFGIVKAVRLLLVMSEKFFFINYLLVKLFADKTWGARRKFIEIEVIIKMFFPLLLILHLPFIHGAVLWVLTILLMYLLAETIVYATKLLFLQDILNPSANVLRSLVLLLVNYFEISFSFAFFYQAYACYGMKINGFIGAIYTSFEYASLNPLNALGKIIVMSQSCITIYFVGIVLAVIVSNFQQRKFNV